MTLKLTMATMTTTNEKKTSDEVFEPIIPYRKTLVKYQNPEIEPQNTNGEFNWDAYKARHPEYHLYADLCERLPKYTRVIEMLGVIDWAKVIPINERGLPF